MTDNEIIKALECCTKTEFISDCAKCEMFAFDCKDILIENAIDLINRQKAKIERLEKIRAKQADIIGEERGQKYELLNKICKAKSEALKELAERLKGWKKYEQNRLI